MMGLTFLKAQCGCAQNDPYRGRSGTSEAGTEIQVRYQGGTGNMVTLKMERCGWAQGILGGKTHRCWRWIEYEVKDMAGSRELGLSAFSTAWLVILFDEII